MVGHQFVWCVSLCVVCQFVYDGLSVYVWWVISLYGVSVCAWCVSLCMMGYQFVCGGSSVCMVCQFVCGVSVCVWWVFQCGIPFLVISKW